MFRSIKVRRLLNPKQSKNTDDLGLCGVVHEVPAAIWDKLMYTIPKLEGKDA